MSDHFKDKFSTKSYPEPEFGKVVAGARADKTIPYHGTGLPPKHTGVQQTRPYQPEKATVKRTTTHNLGTGDTINLNSIRYDIIGILSEEGKTAEAVIYKVKDSRDRIFALKLYYEFSDTHLEPSSDTLQRIREMQADELLFLYDFGTGPNKHNEKYCFEITGFAEGGDLLSVDKISEKYSTDFIENNVIPSIHQGLKALHGERIYHCDLKPRNVFYLDQAQSKIVIGDYGSAKSFDKFSEKELSYTTITKGTEFYLAPEQAFGIVSEKNDYYSLGMIVLHLLYPGEVNRQNLRRIFERRTKGLPIIDFDDRYKRLNRLIQGLTLQDYNNRWGASQVEAWLRGEEVAVVYGASGGNFHLDLNDTMIKTGKELVAFIDAGNSFYDQLIDDREGYSNLLAWVRALEGERAMKQFDGMISYYKQFFGIDYVREAILFYFNPLRPVIMGSGSFVFNGESDPIEQVSAFFHAMDNLWKITAFDKVRLWFFRFEFALQHLRIKSDSRTIKFIDEVFNQISIITETAYSSDFSGMIADFYIHLENRHLPEIFHYFDKKRGFRDLRGNSYFTLFEVNEFLKTRSPVAGEDFLQYEKIAFLKQTGLDEFAEFVELSDDVPGFLLNRDADFKVLPSIVAGLGKGGYSIHFLQDVLKHYRNDEPVIISEVILRLTDPSMPVDVDGNQIFLFNKNDFKNKVDDFFLALENLRFNHPIQKIRKVFFSFEFSLLQLAQSDPVAGKSLVEPVVEAMHKTLHVNLPDWQKLRASFYTALNEKNLVALLYRFNPGRAFCTHTGDFLGSIREVALYYLQFPGKFADQRSAIERELFLEKSGHKRLTGYEFQEFMLNVFRQKTVMDAHIREIRLDENKPGEVSFYYDYEISLDDFMQSQGISGGMKSKSPVTGSITMDRKPMAGENEMYGLFAGALRKKHHFGALSPETRNSFEDAMKSTKHDEFLGSFLLIPRYLVYLLPAFGMLFFSMAYLSDHSLLKQISYAISPSLNYVAERFAPKGTASLVFAAYFLNLLVAVLLLFPLLSLRRRKAWFIRFNRDHGRLISRMTLIMVFVPVIFVGLFRVLQVIAGENLVPPVGALPALSTLSFVILLYILFVLLQILAITGAFFRVSKKIRLMPMLISVIFYFAIGWFAILNYNIG